MKLRYAGPFFRYERPQAGRYRQLQQVGVEAIGVDDPALDAEVIAVADEGFRALGLTGYRLEITSLGDADCRPGLRRAAARVPRRAALDEADPARARRSTRCGCSTTSAPRCAPCSRTRRCWSTTCRRRPPSTTPRCKQHLDDLGVAYVENPRMVRGLDYYTKTTFEFVHDGLGAQSGIGGGGRYDGLMATARRAAAVRRRLRHRRRPDAAGLPGRGGRAVVGRPAARCSGCRWARPRSAGSWCWRRRCAGPGCASTSPTAGAGSRAR